MPRARWKQAVLLALGLALATAVASPLWAPVVADRVLRSAWLRAQLNDQPDQLAFAWRSARAVGWGGLEVENFSLLGQDDDVQWRLQIDHARISLDLPALLERRFQTRSVVARGVRFRLRPRLPAWPARRHLIAARTYPTLPGAGPPVQPAVRTPTSAALRPARWSAQLRGVQLSDVREIWIAAWRLQTRGRATGDFTLHPGLFQLALERGELALTETAVWRGRERLVRGAKGTLKATLRLPDYRPLRGLAYVRPLLAQAQVEGELLAGRLLTPLVGRPAAKLGWARVRATAGLRDGAVTRGSALVLAGATGDVQAAGVSARGPWQLRAEAEPPTLAVTVRMTPATLRSPVLAALTGPNVGVRTAALSLTGRVPLPAVRRPGAAKASPDAGATATWVLRWAESEPAPLAPLLRGLNSGAAQVSAGAWRAGGELRLTRPAPRAGEGARGQGGAADGAAGPSAVRVRGEVEARAVGVVASFAGQTWRGDIVAVVPFRSEGDALNIAGTQVRLDKGRLFTRGHGARAWSGQLTLRSGVLGLAPADRPLAALVADSDALAHAVIRGEPTLAPTLRARVVGSFSDAGPLIDLVRRRGGVPDFVLKRVDTGALKLTARVQASPKQLRLTHVRVTSADVDARGGLRLSGGLRGGLLLKILGFSLGLELHGAKVETHVLRAERWFRGSGW